MGEEIKDPRDARILVLEAEILKLRDGLAVCLKRPEARWRVRCQLEADQLRIELEPETLMEKSVVESMGPVIQAQVKRNGVLIFIMDLPKQLVGKSLTPRPADEVRDQGQKS